MASLIIYFEVAQLCKMSLGPYLWGLFYLNVVVSGFNRGGFTSLRVGEREGRGAGLAFSEFGEFPLLQGAGGRGSKENSTARWFWGCPTLQVSWDLRGARVRSQGTAPVRSQSDPEQIPNRS